MKKTVEEQGFEMIFLALKIIRPNLTQEEAENIISNVGNYIQIKKLKSK